VLGRSPPHPRVRGARAAAAAGAALLALAAAPGAARAAAGEQDWQLSLRLGAGTVDVDGRTPPGIVTGADVEYGFTDAWAVRLSVAAGFHPVSERASDHAPGGTLRTTTALVGVTYTFDVLRLVPYLETGVGVINFGGAVKAPGTGFDAELGLGTDYLLTRRWSVGGVLQYQFTPVQLFSSPMDFGGTSFYFVLSARVSYIF
jgi:hypothetical protein